MLSSILLSIAITLSPVQANDIDALKIHSTESKLDSNEFAGKKDIRINKEQSYILITSKKS